MIEHLHISNYALISEIDIDFHPGFNIITGETGAGKSIILGALGILLGARADTRVIRDASLKSVIEAQFRTDGFYRLSDILLENDIDAIPGVCILRRELSPSGRTRAFINDTPVTLALLRQVAMQLVDIHSQHQNLLLAEADYQLSILDSLAANTDLRDAYSSKYLAYRHAAVAYVSARNAVEKNRADAEFITYQLDQLRELKLKPGEQALLEQEREVLANVSDIKTHLSEAVGHLSGQADAVAHVAQAVNELRRVAAMLSDGDSLVERLDSARIELADIAESLIDADASLGADPVRLDAVDARLSAIYSLEKKHRVDSSDQLIAIRDSLAARLDTIENADSDLAELQAKAKAAKREAVKAAEALSESRRQQAERLAGELRDRAVPLGMKNLNCEIRITPVKLSSSGADEVEFLFAFNKNQPLMPLGQTASGGEISRLMLSVKSLIAEKMQLPTVIFDEVDTGVSGDVAVRMASLMDAIAARAQVIAITHLPAVAAKGSVHFKVYKEDDDISTHTHIRLLSPDERVGELALMLSGTSSDPTARAAAQALLK